jgi:N-acyl-D-amino-acid deacylase
MSTTDLPADAPLDWLVRGGTVIDGTRAPRFDADVGIAGGRIVALAEPGALAGRTARQVLDARGRIVAPGFIDSHTHDDRAVLTQPDMAFKVSQGVTTVITGNCGISVAPMRPGMPLPSPLDLLQTPPEQGAADFDAYFAALRRAPPAVNVGALVGHTTLRAHTMAALDRAATAAEVHEMQQLVRAALEAGVLGLSTGTYYPPAAAATTEEIIDVARPLAGTGAVYATHMRSESHGITEAIDETLRIGRALDCRVVISHHKVMPRAHWGRSVQTLKQIGDAMACQCVALDCYPYVAGSTMIRTDPEMLAGRVIIVTSAPHPECDGRDLADIAAEWGVAPEVAAARLQPGSAIYFTMDEADVQRILAFEPSMIGSDGIPLGDKPHPRLWGTFPRVLGRYSRQLNLFPLETAVWKMSGLTARNFGLAGRGTLAVGQAADVVVFDADRVIDRATFEDPTQPAEGIDAVLVNGVLTWHQGRSTGQRAGRALRRGCLP